MRERRRELIEQLVAGRRAAGLSQTELAARMGTSQSAVARLERGDADTRLSTVERYAAALNSSVDWQLRPLEEAP
jgi:predicted transcriptional regulator